MKICLPMLAVALQMCVPSVTQAASGTIQFVGSIVESRHCQVTELGTQAQAKPQISCSLSGAKPVPATESMVKVSMSDLPSTASTGVNTMHLRRVVTLEYR